MERIGAKTIECNNCMLFKIKIKKIKLVLIDKDLIEIMHKKNYKFEELENTCENWY